MPRNGSGTYSLPAGNPVVTGTTISSTVHNNTMTDIGSEITNSLDKDGQTVVTGTIDFNAQKLVLDGDGDTSIHASTDDVIDIEIEGVDAIKLGWQSVADTGFVTLDPKAFTPDATENTHRVAVLNSNAITVPTGTTALASSVYITEPNITATGTLTEAATVYIAGAPTEGASNYSLFVDAGDVRFDGNLDVSGTTTMGDYLIFDATASFDMYNGATGKNLQISGGSSASLGANEIMYGNGHASAGLFIWRDDVTQNMQLTALGALSTRTGVLGTLSERRFKTEIVEAKSQVDDIQVLASRMKNFVKDDDGVKQLGWIVDEVEDDFPNLIYSEVGMDADGEPDGDIRKGITIGAIQLKAVKALGEALDRIDTLEARLTVLENA